MKNNYQVPRLLLAQEVETKSVLKQAAAAQRVIDGATVRKQDVMKKYL